MKTKLQLSKNVTLNKPDEKRQGMKVRTVVTGHDAKGRAVFVRDEQVDGMPIPGLGELAFLWNALQEIVKKWTANDRRCTGSQQNKSRGAGTRRRLDLHETVTDTDLLI